MSDHDALLAAIYDQPDEDTPRLALADWLEENNQPERAAFIRAQIELARTPPWEPFAVAIRWRNRDWLTGRPFRDTLPPIDDYQVEWPEDAFWRGLPWRLNIRSLVAWYQKEQALVGRAPIGDVKLWSGATLDDLRRFASSPIVRQLRKVHFVTNPIEPLRVLRDVPEALGITDLYFGRASGTGMPVVIEDLFASPLGQVIRGLHFHMGYESLEDLIEALQHAPALERLSFKQMGLTADHVRRLCDGPVMRNVSELDLQGSLLNEDGFWTAVERLPTGIESLSLAAIHTAGRGFSALNVSSALKGLRRLDLSRTPFKPRMARTLARSPQLGGLRSLLLSQSYIGEGGLSWLTRARFWPNLVELDLRDNPIPAAGVKHLLDAPVPPDLAAMILTDTLGSDARKELTRKYGDRVVIVPVESGA